MTCGVSQPQAGRLFPQAVPTALSFSESALGSPQAILLCCCPTARWLLSLGATSSFLWSGLGIKKWCWPGWKPPLMARGCESAWVATKLARIFCQTALMCPTAVTHAASGDEVLWCGQVLLGTSDIPCLWVVSLPSRSQVQTSL